MDCTLNLYEPVQVVHVQYSMGMYSTIVHIDRAWAVIYEYKYPSITLWTVPLTLMHQHRLYCILWVYV